MVGVLLGYLVYGGVDIAMAATLAELWRTACEVLGCRKDGGSFNAEGCRYAVWGKLARTRQGTRQATCYEVSRTEDGLHAFFDNGLAVLDDEQLAALLCQHLDALLRERILRHLLYII